MGSREVRREIAPAFQGASRGGTRAAVVRGPIACGNLHSAGTRKQEQIETFAKFRGSNGGETTDYTDGPDESILH